MVDKQEPLREQPKNISSHVGPEKGLEVLAKVEQVKVKQHAVLVNLK